jgi:hypothetical protein
MSPDQFLQVYSEAGAIIAREHGIPAVINAPDALNIIKDG